MGVRKCISKTRTMILNYGVETLKGKGNDARFVIRLCLGFRT
jgi:hypothetical protein